MLKEIPKILEILKEIPKILEILVPNPEILEMLKEFVNLNLGVNS